MVLLAYSNAKMYQQAKRVCCRRLAMAVPDYQSLMLPFLKIAADGSEHNLSETIETLAQQFDISDQDRKEILPSGRQQRFDKLGLDAIYLQAKRWEGTVTRPVVQG